MLSVSSLNCRSLNMCADLATVYAHFLYTLGDKSYYSQHVPKISDNRLFAMFHSNTPEHNKSIVLQSMVDAYGIVRIVFATTALGMGVDFAGVHTVIHYGAPRSIVDYFQESGRAGRDEKPSTSTVYWLPADASLKKDLSNRVNADIVAVRHYLENDEECQRYQ